MAADIENAFGETSELIQSSGGVFEIEKDGQLLFSKKALNRFPEDNEIIDIVKLLSQGKSLQEAQEEASKNVKKPPSFAEWLGKFLSKRKKPAAS